MCILEIIDVVFDFNDKYVEVDKDDLFDEFDKDLFILGEVFELCFELEDELIDNFYLNYIS